MDASKNSCDSIPDSSIDRVSQGDLRLNRAVASRGAIGRRKADSLIFGGKVKVNGIIETNPGRRVSATDELEINGVIRPPVSEKLYFMLNKPVHCVTTMSDPQSRATALDLFPPEIRAHKIFPVGRLDYFSEGLLIFTNDGDFAHRLAHPSFGKEKIYEVRVREAVGASIVKEMKKGMTLADGTRVAPTGVRVRTLSNGDSLLIMRLNQGLNRQIRKMCDKVGLTILSLKRVAEGGLKLGDLKSGQYRPLTAKEVDSLNNSCARRK